MAKASIAVEHNRGSRTQGSKRGRSISPPAEQDRSRNHSACSSRRGRCSPSIPRHSKATSPARDAKRRHTTKTTADSQQSFQAGAVRTGALSASTICLGRHPHDVYNCSSKTLWDGTPARCQKNENGRLTNPTGSVLCTDWQRPNGCTSTAHDSRHECSGCGKQTHGAQKCPRAQKA